tara:strand:- start:329 stop:751 length:423 start_codon:yes stop_codon:yes gene_type:complete
MKNNKKTIENIVNTSCLVNNIEIEQFYTKNRERHLIDVRRMTYAICRDILNLPYKRIGNFFNVDHATIIHHYRVHNNLTQVDKLYYEKYLSILELVKADMGYLDAQELLQEIRDLKAQKIKQKLELQKLINNYKTENNEN